jgi:hypothetical protein
MRDPRHLLSMQMKDLDFITECFRVESDDASTHS